MVDIKALKIEAVEIRKRTLEIIHNASGGHTGGSLSSIDLLVALYYHVMKVDPGRPDWPERDRFIMSKGHSVEGLYCTLARRGFFDEKELETYGKFNSMLFGHPTRYVPGVELNTGSLGHGLSVGVGLAIAAKRQKLPYRTFVVMGDGEHGEGSIMEAAVSAGHYKLDNLVAIVDRNRLQISGTTEEVMSMARLSDRYKANDWEVLECDGNNMEQLIEMFSSLPYGGGKPMCLIANTVKGKGVSFIENNVVWHHKVPDATQLKQAIEELNLMREEINGQ
jgi:transketolase